MNLKNKKTTLGDDAALYSHREDVSEKEKWESMNSKERLRYFADYYLGKIVSLTGNLATMQCFDGNGEIFKDKVRVNLDFVSMVTVGDRYTSTMAKYVKWR